MHFNKITELNIYINLISIKTKFLIGKIIQYDRSDIGTR